MAMAIKKAHGHEIFHGPGLAIHVLPVAGHGHKRLIQASGGRRSAVPLEPGRGGLSLPPLPLPPSPRGNHSLGVSNTGTLIEQVSTQKCSPESPCYQGVQDA